MKTTMLNRIILMLSTIIFLACSPEDDSLYTANALTYRLTPGSDYDYTGIATVRELRKGGVEIEIVLDGQRALTPYYYPTHLHHGDFNTVNSPMAQMLSPVDAQTLKSVTAVTQLADGSQMNFNRFKQFDGHIKVHLADDGPGYDEILVLGNVGANGIQ